MRREMPPAFINSPASRKKGTARSVKLSAPLSMFCATICGLSMSMCHIIARPETMSAKATGMPSAMAPSNAAMKTNTIIDRAFL